MQFQLYTHATFKALGNKNVHFAYVFKLISMAQFDIEERTVLLLGKSGSGKTSVAKQLCDSDDIKIGSQLDSSSKNEVYLHNVYCNDQKLRIKVLDTRGIQSKDDYESLLSIRDFVGTNAGNGVNLIIFVSKSGRFTKEEESIFSLLLDCFPKDAKPLSAFVLTNCDGKSKAMRHSIVEEFKTHEKTQKYALFMEKGIYTVAFPNIKEVDADETELIKKMILRDRLCLMNLIENSKSRYNASSEKQLFTIPLNYLSTIPDRKVASNTMHQHVGYCPVPPYRSQVSSSKQPIRASRRRDRSSNRRDSIHTCEECCNLM